METHGPAVLASEEGEKQPAIAAGEPDSEDTAAQAEAQAMAESPQEESPQEEFPAVSAKADLPMEENADENTDNLAGDGANLSGAADETPDVSILPAPPEETRPLLSEPRPPILSLPPFIQRTEEPAPPVLAEPLFMEFPEVDLPPALPMPEPELLLSQQSAPAVPGELPREAPREPPRETPREAPKPPPFLRPAEPEIPPPVREPVPGPSAPDFISPLPELPARIPSPADGEQIVFSRVVRATVGQVIEIPFRGTGWVYLGEMGNRRGIAYESRRLDITAGAGGTVSSSGAVSSGGTVEGQSFIFTAEAAGTYILKFYKQDFIQDYIINDYVQVIVGEASLDSGTGRFGYPVDRGRVIAEPRWPPDTAPDSAGAADMVPQSPDVEDRSPPQSPPQAAVIAPDAETAPAAEPPVSPSAGIAVRPRQTLPDEGIVQVAPPQAVPSIDPGASPSEYVRLARQEFNAGRIEQALQILDAMKQRYPSGTDEAWWLYGQLLEANSAARDVRLALEYYRKLVREYPQSPRVPDAERRIAYLERYYFNIR